MDRQGRKAIGEIVGLSPFKQHDRASCLTVKGGQSTDSSSISLIENGSATQSIGKKFAATSVTRTDLTTASIATGPCRSGFGPQLSLSYDSSAEKGSFGFDWNLPLPFKMVLEPEVSN